MIEKLQFKAEDFTEEVSVRVGGKDTKQMVAMSANNEKIAKKAQAIFDEWKPTTLEGKKS